MRWAWGEEAQRRLKEILELAERANKMALDHKKALEKKLGRTL